MRLDIQALKEARLRVGLSIAEASRRTIELGARVSKTYLGQLEAGRYESVSADRLVALARTYGTTVEHFFSGADLANDTSALMELLGRSLKTRDDRLAQMIARFELLEPLVDLNSEVIGIMIHLAVRLSEIDEGHAQGLLAALDALRLELQETARSRHGSAPEQRVALPTSDAPDRALPE